MNRKVIIAGAEVEMTEKKAELYVQRGLAQYAEVVAANAQAQRSAKAPETAAAKPPEDAAKPKPKTTRTKRAKAEK